MFHYSQIEPVAVALGPLQVRWYGLMYLVGFLAAWWLGHRRAEQFEGGLTRRHIDDLLFYCVLGVVLGGRLGYVLFYQTGVLQQDPLYLFRIWEGGMAFHGGLLGVMLATWLYGRRHGFGFFRLSDFIAPLVPIGLGAGRIGNFINGELWGRATDLPWAVQVPCARYPEQCVNLPLDSLWSPPLHPSQLDSLWSPPLHPSQLYEAGLEGLALFVILWIFSTRPRPTMAVSGMFLLFYGLFRFLVEFARQPDAHLGFLAFDRLTMGQLLSLPMLLGGVVLLFLAYRPRPQTE